MMRLWYGQAGGRLSVRPCPDALEPARFASRDQETVAVGVRAADTVGRGGAGDPVAPPGRTVPDDRGGPVQRRIAGAHDRRLTLGFEPEALSPVELAALRRRRQRFHAAVDVAAQRFLVEDATDRAGRAAERCDIRRSGEAGAREDRDHRAGGACDRRAELHDRTPPISLERARLHKRAPPRPRAREDNPAEPLSRFIRYGG